MKQTTLSTDQANNKSGKLRTIWYLTTLSVKTYLQNWMAAPIGICAAAISTLGAATIMIPIDVAHSSIFSRPTTIVLNAIVGPLIAYVLYLSSYYIGMFLKERQTLLGDTGELDSVKFSNWLKVVRYDYLAHVPSDVYLISLAAIFQATLQANGTSVFWAVLMSQFADDFITFLKEPAIWGAAKGLVAWEGKRSTTLFAKIAWMFRGKVVR